MSAKYWLPLFVATGVSMSAMAERAEVVEYNPNTPTAVPAVQPAAPTAEVGILGYVNEKFNRMDRQLEDSADRMDRLERDMGRIRSLELKVAELEKKLVALSVAPSAALPAPTDTAKPATPALSSAELEAAQADYKKAFDQLMAGKYPEAGKLFKAYLDKYPSTDQSSNAHYWLGESYFVGRKFDLALKSYTDSAKLEGPKVSDALLKQGLCYLELKKDKEAKAVFEHLKKEYPETSAGKQADKQLSAMKK